METREHEVIFENYIRHNSIPEKRNIITSNGSVYLPAKMAEAIFLVMREFPLQKLITRETTGYLKNRVPYIKSNVPVSWTSEGEEYPKFDFELSEKVLKQNKVGAIIKVSEELTADSSFNIMQLLSESFGHALGEELEKVFISGYGNKKPSGFIHDCNNVSAAGSTIQYQDIINVFNELELKYLVNASWLVSQKTLSELSVLADSNNNKLLSPGSSEADGYMLGKPVHITFMPDHSPLCLGDYQYYKVLDKAPEIKHLGELYALEGLVGFRLTQYLDGKLIEPNAICALEM